MASVTNYNKVVAYDATVIPATAFPSNPIAVPTSSTKLFIDLKYTQGKEDGIVLSLEYQDTARDYWSKVGDIGGSPAPGKNAILAFEWTLGTSGAWLIAVPQHLVAQGDYRLSLIRDGSTAPDGTITAYLKVGEY